MNMKMNDLISTMETIGEYLQFTADISIHSTPNYFLEFVLAAVILLNVGFLVYEIKWVSKKMIRLKPNTVYCAKDSISNGSAGTSVTHYHEIFAVSDNSSTTIAYKRMGQNFAKSTSQMGWVLPTKPTNAKPEKTPYFEHLVNLTPEQFVKIDKERKLRDKDMDNYMTSLSTLCKNVLKRKFSSRTLSKQVEMARENLQCNKMSLEGKYLGFKTDAMTRSLFCMLEKMITNSSLKNPLPFKGDITTLALDVADLSTDTHYINQNVGKWDVNNSTSYISDESGEDSDTMREIKSEKGMWDSDEIHTLALI